MTEVKQSAGGSVNKRVNFTYRTGGGYLTGQGNRLLSDGTYIYQYDAEGNRTARFVDVDLDGQLSAGDTDVTAYAWDYRNRLVEVTERAVEGGAATQVVAYSYDASDRRIQRTLDSDGDGTPEDYRYQLHCGGEAALELSDPDGLEGETYAPALAHRYLYGAAVDQILAVEDDSGDVLWGLADHQGTIRDVIDSAAFLVQHRKYDSFGNADVTPVADFLFSYTGRPLDPDTGLYDYRARWYDAEVGRFVSEDPLGFAAGDMNTYRYVGNSPLDYTDPSGMSSFSGVGSLAPSMDSLSDQGLRYTSDSTWTRGYSTSPIASSVPAATSSGDSTWMWEYSAAPTIGIDSTTPVFRSSSAPELPLGLVKTDVGYVTVWSDGKATLDSGTSGRIDSNRHFIPDDPNVIFPVEPSSATIWAGLFTSASVGAAYQAAGGGVKGLGAAGVQLGKEAFEYETGIPLDLIPTQPTRILNTVDDLPAGMVSRPASAPGAVSGTTVIDTGVYPKVPGTGTADTLPTRAPKPSPNYQPPTNAPQLPPSQIPTGWRIRSMPPTQQYPNGYWRLEKPMPHGGWQGIDPSTMRPGPQPQTHVPWPDPNS